MGKNVNRQVELAKLRNRVRERRMKTSTSASLQRLTGSTARLANVVRTSLFLFPRFTTLANMPHSCFFYGSLLHPAVLKKVLENDAEHLTFCPAVLFVRKNTSTLAHHLTSAGSH
jgi:hypothetical protein